MNRLFQIFAILLGISLNIPTGLPGRLRVGEIFMVALVPLAFQWLRRSERYYKRIVYRVVYCLVALFVWHVTVDLLLATPPGKMIDIAASFGFCGMKLFVLAAMVLRSPHTLVPLLLGMAVGQYAFTEEIQTSQQILQDEYWDLKVAAWAGPLMIAGILSFGKYSKLLMVTSVAIYGALAAYFGARSHGLTMFVAVGIPYLLSIAKRHNLGGKKRSVLKLAAVAAVTAVLMSAVYVHAARAGLLTEKSKVQLQGIKNPYNPIELIWSGRGGTMIGFVGAFERPVLGFGSMTFRSTRFAEGRIEDAWQIIHSMIVESMVYGGLFPLVFWYLICRYAFDLYPFTPVNTRAVGHHHILATLTLVGLYWALLFSPLVSARFDLPLYFCVLLHCHRALASPRGAKSGRRPSTAGRRVASPVLGVRPQEV